MDVLDSVPWEFGRRLKLRLLVWSSLGLKCHAVVGVVTICCGYWVCWLWCGCLCVVMWTLFFVWVVFAVVVVVEVEMDDVSANFGSWGSIQAKSLVVLGECESIS